MHQAMPARLLAFMIFGTSVQPLWSIKSTVKTKKQFLDADPGGGGSVIPRTFSLEVLRTIPHQGQPFTQGLEIHQNGKHIVETSGSYPPGTESFIRTVDPVTGSAYGDPMKDGLSNRFVEGITQHRNGNWFASTYTDNKIIEYSPDMTEKIGEHVYPTMGWGLTRHPDGESFLATNSTEHLMTIGRDEDNSFKITDSKVVNCMGKRVMGLNELELIDDFFGKPAMLGNVYQTRLVLAVDPPTGQCVGVFHLEDVGDIQTGENAGFHVANGVAYNRTSGTLITTGKNWANMFEVRLKEEEDPAALGKLSSFLLKAPALSDTGVPEVSLMQTPTPAETVHKAPFVRRE